MSEYTDWEVITVNEVRAGDTIHVPSFGGWTGLVESVEKDGGVGFSGPKLNLVKGSPVQCWDNVSIYRKPRTGN